ncbi:MAG: hypothetical protein A2148_02355 [Chloroflexi bacterium RBG_16_68_14]|nr:MAG: hypothetical protein A2148_02355 [Chloroflexi bacterium RBG_16_68_14]
MEGFSNSSEEAQPGPYAGFWARFTASLIDWGICFFAPALISSFAFAAISGSEDPGRILASLLILIVLACPLGYFTYFGARGQSLGMKVLRIQIVGAKTGKTPGVARALVRSALALVLGASVFVLAVVGFSDAPAGYSAADLVGIYGAVAGFVGGILGHVWMLLDRRNQTLQDKVSGVVVLRR